MAHRLLLTTVILAFGLFTNQLQASPLTLLQNFYPQPPVLGEDLNPPSLYPPETFPDLRVAGSASGLAGLPAGEAHSPGSLIVPWLTSLAPPTCRPQWSRRPLLAAKPPAPSPPAAASTRVKTLALTHLHTPYRRGGSLRTGRATDCSGFVRFVYHKLHIELPRSSVQQARVGRVAARSMDFAKLQVGDLLFFSQARRSIGHVGIYVGEGKMIHASSRRHRVVVTDLRQDYYEDKFVVAKRLLGKP